MAFLSEHLQTINRGNFFCKPRMLYCMYLYSHKELYLALIYHGTLLNYIHKQNGRTLPFILILIYTPIVN